MHRSRATTGVATSQNGANNCVWVPLALRLWASPTPTTRIHVFKAIFAGGRTPHYDHYIRPPAHRQRLVYLWETDAAGSSSSLVKIPLGSRWLLSGWVAGDEQIHTYTLCTPRVKQWRRITRLISHAGGTFLSRLTASGLIVGAFVVYRSVYESHTTYSLA